MDTKKKNELYHHGIKGQKWGVRRYQNSDGSLTAEGKKISKKYKKAQTRGDRDLSRSYQSLYLKAYNKSANKMNNGMIDQFNKSQEKKYGKDYAKRSGYDEDYMNMFNKELSKNLSMSVNEFRKQNKNYQKATELVKKYEMTKWNDLAKSNSDALEQMKSEFN